MKVLEIRWGDGYPLFVLEDGRQFKPLTGEWAGYYEEVDRAWAALSPQNKPKLAGAPDANPTGKVSEPTKCEAGEWPTYTGQLSGPCPNDAVAMESWFDDEGVEVWLCEAHQDGESADLGHIPQPEGGTE